MRPLTRRLSLAAATTLLSGLMSPAFAQPTLSAGTASTGLGGTATVAIDVAVDASDGIASWSFSLCHDELVLDPVSVVVGADLQTLGPGGGPVTFEETVIVRNDLSGFDSGGAALPDVDPMSSPGISQIVITDFSPSTALPTGNFTLSVIDYEAIGPGASSLDFCATIAPQTGSFRVTEFSDGSGVVPATLNSGSVMVTSTSSLEVAPGLTVAPMAQITAPIWLSSPTNAVNGFQFGLAHDSAIVTPQSATLTPGLFSGTPAFFAVDLDPVNGDGVVVIALLAISPPFGSIAPGLDIPVVDVVYSASPAAQPGDITALTFVDDLQPEPSSLPAMISVAFEFSTEIPTTTAGQIEIASIFIRGEIDGSAGIGLPDAISLLQSLFGPTMPTLLCADAADLDDNGSLGVSDVIALLNLLIGSSPVVPAPSPLVGCDFDPTPDALDCDMFDQNLCP